MEVWWRSCKLGLYSFMPLNDYCAPGLHHSFCNFELNTVNACKWMKNKLMVLPDVTGGNNVCWWNSRFKTPLHSLCMCAMWAMSKVASFHSAESWINCRLLVWWDWVEVLFAVAFFGASAFLLKLFWCKDMLPMDVLTSVAHKMLFTAVSSVPLLSVLQHNLIGDHIILYDPNNTMQFYWKLLNDNMNTNYCPAVIRSRNLLPVNTATLHNLSISLSLCFVFAFICLSLG